MDGKEIDYEQHIGTFNKLATKNGEIVALISRLRYGDIPVTYTEKGALRAYQIDKAHNAEMSSHHLYQTWLSKHEMELKQYARAKIQEAKIRHRIPLDTPSIGEIPPVPRPVNVFKSANDEEVYSADVHTLEP